MKKHLTWRDVRDRLNELDEKDLDNEAFVWLDDMVWMIDAGGTAGNYPITSVHADCIYIDDGSDDEWIYEAGDIVEYKGELAMVARRADEDEDGNPVDDFDEDEPMYVLHFDGFIGIEYAYQSELSPRA